MGKTYGFLRVMFFFLNDSLTQRDVFQSKKDHLILHTAFHCFPVGEEGKQDTIPTSQHASSFVEVNGDIKFRWWLRGDKTGAGTHCIQKPAQAGGLLTPLDP